MKALYTNTKTTFGAAEEPVPPESCYKFLNGLKSWLAIKQRLFGSAEEYLY